jgi:hypothetical protein
MMQHVRNVALSVIALAGILILGQQHPTLVAAQDQHSWEYPLLKISVGQQQTTGRILSRDWKT